MPGTNAQAAPEDRGRHLLLYDGTCGLCHGIIRYVLALDPDGIFHFTTLQGALGASHSARAGIAPGRLDSFIVVADYQSDARTYLVKGRAAVFVCNSLGWPWKAATPLGLLPVAVLDAGYDLVARRRYRFFGRRDHCFVPRAQLRHRFVERHIDSATEDVLR